MGDAYLACSGVPEPRWDHAQAAVEMALQILEFIPTQANLKSISLRIGISIGPIIAGVIGLERLMYDIYGYTVVQAHKLESTGEPNRIQVSETMYNHLQMRFPDRYVSE